MTDDHSKLVRLEEKMEDVERWIETHKDLGVDVALLKHCISTYNGSIKKIDENVGKLKSTVDTWAGSVKTLKWVLGFVGLGIITQIVLSAIGVD